MNRREVNVGKEEETMDIETHIIIWGKATFINDLDIWKREIFFPLPPWERELLLKDKSFDSTNSWKFQGSWEQKVIYVLM